jgi:Reverse transcriptase (RNA-dependent DNA polymerase)
MAHLDCGEVFPRWRPDGKELLRRAGRSDDSRPEKSVLDGRVKWHAAAIEHVLKVAKSVPDGATVADALSNDQLHQLRPVVGDEVGTPRAVISPLLANIYLHYAFDLWVEAWRKKAATGDVIVVRDADDLVMGFERRTEAELFLVEFQRRLARFGLELHVGKTRLIEFGRQAARNRRQRGEGKPETFTFLGFTHFCGHLTTGPFII